MEVNYSARCPVRGPKPVPREVNTAPLVNVKNLAFFLRLIYLQNSLNRAGSPLSLVSFFAVGAARAFALLPLLHRGFLRLRTRILFPA